MAYRPKTKAGSLTALMRGLVVGAVLVFLSVSAISGSVFSQTPAPSGVPTEAPGTDVGVDVAGTKLILTGCASPNAFVQVFRNDALAGTTVATSNGRFTKEITVNNASAGLHKLQVYYEDANNRTSAIAEKNISLSSQSATALDLLLPTTIEHEPEPVAAGSYLIFRGSTCPGALVNVNLDNNLTLAARADSKGNWYVIADTQDYYEGSHVYEALSSLDDKISPKTQKYLFNVTGGDQTQRESPAELTVPSITEPNDLFLSGTDAATIRGTGPINTQIELFVDGSPAGSVFTNASGQWSFALNLEKEFTTVTARACHENKCSDLSDAVRIRYVGDDTSCTASFRLKNYRFHGIRQNQGIDLELTDVRGTEPLDTQIDWGDGSVEHQTLEDTRQRKIHHVYDNYGQFNGTIAISDADGCQVTSYFSVLVVPDNPPDWWMLGVIPMAGGAVYLLSRFVGAYQNQPRWIPPAEDEDHRPAGQPPSRPWPKPAYGGSEESAEESNPNRKQS